MPISNPHRRCLHSLKPSTQSHQPQRHVCVEPLIMFIDNIMETVSATQHLIVSLERIHLRFQQMFSQHGFKVKMVANLECNHVIPLSFITQYCFHWQFTLGWVLWPDTPFISVSVWIRWVCVYRRLSQTSIYVYYSPPIHEC